MSYRIKSVAALTGITTATLRAWERRYGIVSPARTDGGYRVYSEDDVARLIRIKSMVDRGYKVGEAVALLDHNGAPEVPPLSIPADFVAEIRAQLLEALLALDRPRADRITDQLAFLPFDRQVDELLMPLLREVGEYWEHRRGSVAQEHFVSVFAREKLIGMLEYLESGPAGGREVVCAGAPGDLHELGLLATAIHLALAGWRVTYFGADVPLEDLETVLRERVPLLVCSSIITPREAEECLELARRVRRSAPPETRVVLGGSGIPESILGEPERGLHLLRGFAELFELLAEG
ncbi:cobalamin-dependent protein [soil metagenome]